MTNIILEDFFYKKLKNSILQKKFYHLSPNVNS